ncbi:ribosomal protein S18-alanine N-acetyltransferase [Inediibacterium massiliense]|uniref:ribosomal protein S18-alanine N-acetyltransferase n=1 Tax=Inediibacterium massiliense TaxID=1658111 RepID=UPI0006B44D3C|nr:ribosomal protein S18-alanine N-acetyltransferase [Inediibacterium massiliense]
MDNVSVRFMEQKDIEEVFQVEKKCFTIPWSRHSFLQEMRNEMAIYVVIEDHEKVVGYGGMWKIVDEGHITNIAIHPTYRKKGYGDKVVKALIQIAKEQKINSMTLEVRASNEVAKCLYEKNGFYSCGVRPKYYEDNGEDAVIMWAEFQ